MSGKPLQINVEAPLESRESGTPRDFVFEAKPDQPDKLTVNWKARKRRRQILILEFRALRRPACHF